MVFDSELVWVDVYGVVNEEVTKDCKYIEIQLSIITIIAKLTYEWHLANLRYQYYLMKYPLYDELASMKVGEDYQVSFIFHAASLTLEQRKVLYALILHHHFKDNDVSNSGRIPYGGTLMHGNKGVLTDLNNIPKKLRSVLYAYVKSIKG